MVRTTPRQRQRADTVTAIKDAARRRLREGGHQALSMRGIAADLGVTPPALYSYFDGVADLLTDLVAESYDGLAATLEAARDAQSRASVAVRFLAVTEALREWALRHRAEFTLIYGDPVPGYEAPRPGPTDASARRANGAVLDVLRDAWHAGALRLDGPDGEDADLDAEVRSPFLAQGSPYPQDPRFARACVYVWAHVHGLVSLELHGHLSPLTDDPAAEYRAQMLILARQLGMA